MTNHLVEGRLLPDHVAGHVALELCNTKAMWDLPSEREYLTDFTAAVLWAREHELISADEARALRRQSVARQRAALGQLRALRGALFRVVVAAPAPSELTQVHRFVARAVARSAYRRSGTALSLTVPLSSGVIADRAALAAHALLERYGPAAVGLCAGEPCGWVFLDPSHRRRWCTMAVCGNRAKARRFAQRAR